MSVKLGVVASIQFRTADSGLMHYYKLIFDHCPTQPEVCVALMRLAAEPDTSDRGRARLVDASIAVAELETFPVLDMSASTIRAEKAESDSVRITLSVSPLFTTADDVKKVQEILREESPQVVDPQVVDRALDLAVARVGALAKVQYLSHKEIRETFVRQAQHKIANEARHRRVCRCFR